ncbi:hypothetical protein HU200_034256 [Digitaria exilis]|uniref:SBP-type domain-containing protein n=1 Tax=Digitaria exilis TaxID=1010633 RepID=A0A835BKR4_9POAL|nr:hypothetical protein HU200_034256 [Digitaria exilis]
MSLFFRFHELLEFDDVKHSCRRRLAGHNERRRKSSADRHGSGGDQDGRSHPGNPKKNSNNGNERPGRSNGLYIGFPNGVAAPAPSTTASIARTNMLLPADPAFLQPVFASTRRQIVILSANDAFPTTWPSLRLATTSMRRTSCWTRPWT